MISVKYFGRDPVTGHHRISRKVLTALTTKTFKFVKDGKYSPLGWFKFRYFIILEDSGSFNSSLILYLNKTRRFICQYKA